MSVLDGLHDTFTRQYGPLKGWQWAGIGAAGVVAVGLLLKGRAPAGSSGAPVPAGTLSFDQGGGGGGGGFELPPFPELPPIGDSVGEQSFVNEPARPDVTASFSVDGISGGAPVAAQPAATELVVPPGTGGYTAWGIGDLGALAKITYGPDGSTTSVYSGADAGIAKDELVRQLSESLKMAPAQTGPLGVPTQVGGTLPYLPATPLPSAPTEVNLQDGVSYVFPNVNTDTHVATVEAQEKGSRGSFQPLE